ncbi:MAG: prepilin-type N-terminal cleavage/methylation domain-containing protein, partial [Candidatus Omnitrophica bacterium]|nr:prepilin-type N-terminal cleavage/methylation domain-containing protein [Candidatus Omnitrophota bacterium]
MMIGSECPMSPKTIKKNNAFTLIEVLVGMIIIVAMSAAAWMAVTALRA